MLETGKSFENYCTCLYLQIDQVWCFNELFFKRFFKKTYLVSCTNSHHDVTDLENCEMVKKAKTWISWERNITFPQNKKIVNLCSRWYILRSYHFVADITFNLHMSILYKRKTLYWSITELDSIVKNLSEQSVATSQPKEYFSWSHQHVLRTARDYFHSL